MVVVAGSPNLLVPTEKGKMVVPSGSGGGGGGTILPWYMACAGVACPDAILARPATADAMLSVYCAQMFMRAAIQLASDQYGRDCAIQTSTVHATTWT